jgi:beta-glucosidase
MMLTSILSSDIHLSRSTIGRTDNAAVQVSVRNNGAVKAKEVVQVYATDLVSSAVTSATQLVGFVKVEIGPNSSKRVTIPVSNDALKMWTAQGKWEVEAGEFNLRVGTSDQTWASAILTVA